MKTYFKTLSQQLEILESRGLLIANPEFAKKSLLHFNYYKLINATSAFVTDKDGRYIRGISFEHLLYIHDFEKELKQKLLGTTLEIERHARSIISYIFTKNHPSDNSYLDKRNFVRDDPLVLTNIFDMEKTIDRFSNEQNYKKSMGHYINKYGSIPFWFLVNFISFGKLINIYQTMLHEDRIEVADEFEKFIEDNLKMELEDHLSPKKLESYLSNVKDLRNLCAHDNLILGYRFEKPIIYFKSLFDEEFEERKRDDLYSVYLSMRALISRSQFLSIRQSLVKRTRRLRANIPSIAYEKLMRSIGFPLNFNEEEI